MIKERPCNIEHNLQQREKHKNGYEKFHLCKKIIWPSSFHYLHSKYYPGWQLGLDGLFFLPIIPLFYSQLFNPLISSSYLLFLYDIYILIRFLIKFSSKIRTNTKARCDKLKLKNDRESSQQASATCSNNHLISNTLTNVTMQAINSS